MAALKINISDALYRRLQEVTRILADAVQVEARGTHSILELQGLGKELWKGIDTAKYIDDERRSWD